MLLQQIFQRIQTIYFILNPEYSLIVDQENSDQGEMSDQWNFNKEQKLLQNMDKLVKDFEEWITSEFGKDYCRAQQYLTLEQNLQKQQYQVRQHIKMQEQMKIYYQKVCSDFEVLQKSYEYLDTEAEYAIKNLRKQNKKLLQQATELKKSIADLTHRDSICSPVNTEKGVLKSLNQGFYVHFADENPPKKLCLDSIGLNGLETSKKRYKYIYYTPINEFSQNQNRNQKYLNID